MTKKVVTYLITTVVTLVCIGVMVMGYLNWSQRLDTTVQASSVERREMNKEEAKTRLKSVENASKHLSTGLKNKFSQAVKEERALNLTLLGSEYTSTWPDAWPELLERNLRKSYGNDMINVTVKSYPDMTSKDLLTNDVTDDVLSTNPDIIVFEVPLVQDYPSIKGVETIQNVGSLIASLQKKQAAVVLQPPIPLYQNKSYEKEVQNLRTWANKSNYTYLNHWANWPNRENKELLDYLSEDRLTPNEKGQRVWADFLTNYFASK